MNSTPNSEDLKHETAKSVEIKSLNSALARYTKATIDNDIPTLLTFVYPKVFTLLPKEKMEAMLERMYASGKAPNITEIRHQKISPIKQYDKGIYSIITSKMAMELKSPTPDNEKFEEILLDKLKQQMGANVEVSLDKSKHLFVVKKESQIIGINENSEGWKFVGYQQAKKYAEKNIIPKSITDNL
jgi:hypothetical protein